MKTTDTNPAPANPVAEVPALTTAEKLAAAESELARIAAASEQAAADEIVIRTKMESGLTREQAVSVISRQRKFDERKKTIYQPKLEAERAKQTRFHNLTRDFLSGVNSAPAEPNT